MNLDVFQDNSDGIPLENIQGRGDDNSNLLAELTENAKYAAELIHRESQSVIGREKKEKLELQEKLRKKEEENGILVQTVKQVRLYLYCPYPVNHYVIFL